MGGKQGAPGSGSVLAVCSPRGPSALPGTCVSPLRGPSGRGECLGGLSCQRARTWRGVELAPPSLSASSWAWPPAPLDPRPSPVPCVLTALTSGAAQALGSTCALCLACDVQLRRGPAGRPTALRASGAGDDRTGRRGLWRAVPRVGVSEGPAASTLGARARPCGQDTHPLPWIWLRLVCRWPSRGTCGAEAQGSEVFTANWRPAWGRGISEGRGPTCTSSGRRPRGVKGAVPPQLCVRSDRCGPLCPGPACCSSPHPAPNLGTSQIRCSGFPPSRAGLGVPRPVWTDREGPAPGASAPLCPHKFVSSEAHGCVPSTG